LIGTRGLAQKIIGFEARPEPMSFTDEEIKIVEESTNN